MKWIKLSVACFVVCVLKCSAKSLNDIEEFSEFLLKTSQLDEILKKGHNPDDDSDEDEPVSDHAWEESGKFEGDLILNERQRRLIIEDVAEGLSRNGLKDSTKRWPDNEVIYYIQKEHFSGDQVQAIQSGIDDIAQASCVKFRPYKKGDRDAVVIQGSRRGCFSQVGYQGGYQVLNLSGRHPVGRGCFRHGTVVHELLHTLGFYHMQSSPDRDDYIDVIWENIIQPARHNFRKYNSFAVSDFGVGYDYDSVLHYSRRAFSANGGDTLVPKQNGASIGQRIGLSDKDTQKLNKMYCDADSNNSDAEEDTAKKSATKKKSPKNKPFEGHGIGYHQGKTVVIKLPAAETYKLPDLPTFHVFDYFSKTPQTVSPALIEGIGFGKEIEYTYQPELHTEKYDEKIATLHNSQTLPNDNHNNSNNENNYQGNIDKSIKPSIHDNAGIVKPEDQKISEESSPEPEGSSGPFEKVDDDLSEAFERLGKIIKTHVYPSQTPNLSVYKMADYNEFYTPPKKFTTDPEIHKEIHKDTSISDMESSTEYDYGYDRVVAPDKKPQQFIKNLYGPESSSPDKQNNDVIRKDTSLSDNESSTEDEHRYDRVTVPDEKLHRFIQNLYEPKSSSPDKQNNDAIHNDTSLSDIKSSTEDEHSYDRITVPDEKPHRFIQNLYELKNSTPDKPNEDEIHKGTSISDMESSTEYEHSYDRVTVPNEKPHRFIQNLYQSKSSSPDKQNNDSIHKDTFLSDNESSTEDEHSYDRITVPDEKPHRFIQNLYEPKNSTPNKPNEDEIHKGTSLSDIESSTEDGHSYDRVTVLDEKPHRFIQNLDESKSSSPEKQNNDSIHKDTFLSDIESSIYEHSYDRVTVPDEKPHRFIQNLNEPQNSSLDKQNNDAILEHFKMKNPTSDDTSISFYDTPKSRATDLSSSKPANPLNEMILTNKHKMLTPKYATFEHLRHKPNYINSYYPGTEDNSNFKTKRIHTLLGYVVPLKDNWIKKYEKFKQKHRDIDSDQNKDKSDRPHTSRISDRDSGFENSRSPIPSGNQAFSIYGVLVPFSENWHKEDYDPHKNSYSIDKSESHEDNR